MANERIKLSRNWKFKFYLKGDYEAQVFSTDFDDHEWDVVRVPHDWAISGRFEKHNDSSIQEILADGILHPIEHTGRTGALPTVGKGIYRIYLDIPKEKKGERITLEFDGIMWEANIYVNGSHVHFNHWGYKSFEVDITDFVNYGSATLVAVEAEVFPACSRWYSGAGIFRNVYLVSKKQQHINYHGVWLRQLEVTRDTAAFELSLDYTGDTAVKFQADIYSREGVCVAAVANKVSDFGELSGIFTIPDVMLWDIESPYLYTAKVELLNACGEILDREEVKFGVRTFAFTSDKGFFLNGRRLKLHGTCYHHDLGSLGAIVNETALHRRFQILKEMGVNAIRTSHNPPSPELLKLCDEMGFLVIDEFFDEWYTPKVPNGYAKYFHTHAVEDASDIIKRDRNHPSIILWSLGNEINEQKLAEGWRAAKLLSEVCHRLDPTRLTTAGFDGPLLAFENHLTDYVDVIGINYKPHLYDQIHEKHPDAKLYGSETASCVSTRGIYKLPAEIAIPAIIREDLTVSAYDMEAPGHAYYVEREFAAQDDKEYIAGEFIWTAFDYLGEPTPYYGSWPSRSSYFGAMDLNGLPKNRYYAYVAQWTDKKLLHVFPHWNWEGLEGSVVPVHAYTSYAEAELFINGKSYGRQQTGNKSGGNMGEIERYRLMWQDAVYEPGEVQVVAYDEQGVRAAKTVVKTAGAPHHIELRLEKQKLVSDGEDLVYAIATVVDKDGTVCPHACDRLYFSAENCELLTTDNGDQRETESFITHDKRCLAGYCVACVRSVEGSQGVSKIAVSAEGLEGACVEITLLCNSSINM